MTDSGLYDDQRGLKRRHLIYYLRVFDNTTGDLLGHLVNITTEGIMLISEGKLPTGKTQELRMLLPAEILTKEELVFQAKALWCKEDINPDFFATGFKISGITTEDVDVIEGLIRRHGFQD